MRMADILNRQINFRFFSMRIKATCTWLDATVVKHSAALLGPEDWVKE